MKQYNNPKGASGETLVCEYLIKNKYKLIERNFKNKIGEIDIIAQKDDYIVFVEVKSRDTLSFGRPSEAVNYYKQQKIKKVALSYLKFKHLMDCAVRFDVAEVLDGKLDNYIENAF